MKLKDMVCCSWHTPKNAIVHCETGDIVPTRILNSIRDGPGKDHVLYSGGMCDPCAEQFLGGKERQPMAEPIIGAIRK